MAFLEPFIAGAEVAGEAAGAAGEAAGAAGEAAGEAGEEVSSLPSQGQISSKGGGHVKVHKVKDNSKLVARVLAAFEAKRVLVGIPSEKNDRSGTEPGALNNATIGIIMEKGSPAANIPARPWLVPGIESAHKRIVARYEQAVKAALKQNSVTPVTQAHAEVGQIAADAVRSYLLHADFTPLKPATIAARARQRGTRRRKGEIKYLGLVAGGMAPAMAQNVAGIRPLINTGQLRGAITWMVRKKGEKGTYRGTKTMRVL